MCAGVSAQTDAAVALDRQTDEAFRQVLRQPQELALWTRYAQLLVQAGNYEGGIAALERVLLTPDATPELQVDVAVLYFRLASFAMAEGLLREALADNRLTGAKRTFAEALLADVIQRNQRNQLIGSVTFGLRHQTNPLYRSGEAEVLSGGVPVALPASLGPASDNDISVGLAIRHRYDLDLQNSATIATNAGAYLVDYRSSSGSRLQATPTAPYDLQVLDLNTGVEFKPLPADASGLTLRPHVILSNVVAQRHQYLRNQGLGLDLTWRPDERTLYEFTLDGQDRRFANRIDITNADLLDGRLYALRARVSRELGAGQVLVGEYAVRRNSTGSDMYDYKSHEARVTYAVSYASPLASGSYWSTAVWFGALQRDYGAPDPSVSPTRTRKDREWRVGVSHSMPLAPQWSLQLVLEHSRNQANLPNFRYKNTLLSSTVVRSF